MHLCRYRSDLFVVCDVVEVVRKSLTFTQYVFKKAYQVISLFVV